MRVGGLLSHDVRDRHDADLADVLEQPEAQQSVGADPREMLRAGGRRGHRRRPPSAAVPADLGVIASGGTTPAEGGTTSQRTKRDPNRCVVEPLGDRPEGQVRPDLLLAIGTLETEDEPPSVRSCPLTAMRSPQVPGSSPEPEPSIAGQVGKIGRRHQGTVRVGDTDNPGGIAAVREEPLDRIGQVALRRMVPKVARKPAQLSVRTAVATGPRAAMPTNAAISVRSGSTFGGTIARWSR